MSALRRGDGSDVLERPQFFRILPRELRDMVYLHASCNGSRVVKIKMIRDKEKREELKKSYEKVGYVHQLVPNSPLRSMAVCKQFYEEACDQWFRENTLTFGYSFDFCDFVDRLGPASLARVKAVRLHWKAKCQDCLGIWSLLRCITLRHVTLVVDPFIFDQGYHGEIWEMDAYEPEDFLKLSDINSILLHPRLESVVIEANQNTYLWWGNSQEAVWRKNVAGLNDYLQDRLATHEAKVIQPHETEGNEKVELPYTYLLALIVVPIFIMFWALLAEFEIDSLPSRVQHRLVTAINQRSIWRQNSTSAVTDFGYQVLA